MKADEPVSLLSYFEARLAEADKRYEQRFIATEKALDAALIASKELTEQASSSARDALSKAASELDQYKTANNEWRGTINDWRQSLLPRSEYTVRDASISREIADLQRFRNEAGGEKAANQETHGDRQVSTGWYVAIGLAALEILLRLLKI